jgi:hypothetical protein
MPPEEGKVLHTEATRFLTKRLPFRFADAATIAAIGATI